MNSASPQAECSPSLISQESVFRAIKKNHPLFQYNFVTDDWVENHGVWTLTEAAITLAISDYQNNIESHNTQLTSQIALGEQEAAKLREELTGLVAWDKKKRGEITAALGGLKSDLRDTKSDTVRGDLGAQIGTLEKQLTTMATDRDRRNAIEAQLGKLLEAGKTFAGKKISLQQQASLAEDLQGALNGISIHARKSPARLVAAPSSKSFLGSTRGQVTMTVCALLVGAGVAVWNIGDQIKKGEEPVNLIERLLRGSKPKNDTPQPLNADAGGDFYRQAAIMFMRDKITSAKKETLSQISQDGSIQGLNVRLKTNIEKAFSGQPGDIVIKENKGESGCPIFTIMFTQGKNTYIESMGTSEIFNSIDTWITNQLIANHFKGDMAAVMLAESYSNQPVQTREIVIQSIAQSSIAVTFDEKMKRNGYQLNTTDSGIIWDPATGRPAFKIVYFFGNPGAQQVLIKPFVQLP